jgi:hypothetical protein
MRQPRTDALTLTDGFYMHTWRQASLKNADAGAAYVFVPSRIGTGEDAPAE